VQESIESERQFKLKKSITESTVDDNSKQEDVVIEEEKKQEIRFSHWLKKPKFYLFGICYMCVRLNSNVFGTFVPFYLIYVLKLSVGEGEQSTIPFSVALVPLIIYASSSVLSAKISWLYGKIGRKNTLLLGTVLSILSLGLLFTLDTYNGNLIYILALFIGCSQSLILTTGINLISDVVGSKSDSGAIVFGIYSFLDKIATGLIIYFIAQLSCFSASSGSLTESEEQAIKATVILIPMLSAIAAAVAVQCGTVSEYSKAALSESKLQKQ
jgi:Na+/melibiose symporter-like transporter